MRRIISSFFIFLSTVLILSGCATGRKQSDLEIQGLKNQIQALEAQVQEKDAELGSLKESFDKPQEEKSSSYCRGQSGEIKSRPKARQIQSALKNAGYNPGAIDGRLGKQTRDAIMAFQKANNLRADGKVGKKTWKLLRKHLKSYVSKLAEE